MRMRRIFRQLIGWAAAAAVAVLLCNLGLYAYHRPAAWVNRTGSATDAILRPGSVTLMGTEGRGLHRVDRKGYLNPDLPLAEEYVLVVGSSFVQGKEVAAGKRFVDLMNTALAESPDVLAVYSVSQDGFYFPDMVRCFQALVQEFPGADTIVLETNLADFTSEELRSALDQHGLEESQQGEQLLDGMSTMQRLIMTIKETFPILNLGKVQLTAMLGSGSGTASAEKPEQMPEEAMYAVMARLRSQFAGRIVVYYHPDVEIRQDGSLSPLAQPQVELMRRACQENDIEFVDATQAFLDAYERDYAVPYGFGDTSMGGGHFNEDGHRISAELLLQVLKGGDGA